MRYGYYKGEKHCILSKYERKAWDFIKKCIGWQGYNIHDALTVKSVKSLERAGLVKINVFGQFKAI